MTNLSVAVSALTMVNDATGGRAGVNCQMRCGH